MLRKTEKKKNRGGGKRRKRFVRWMMRRNNNKEDGLLNDVDIELGNNNETKRVRGFPFQHSGESMGCKERFRIRVVEQPVSFVSFLEPRVVVDD